MSGTIALRHPSGGGPSSGRRAGARPLFGDPELERFYRCATSLIIKQKIFRMCRVTEIEGGHQLTVCNLWRVERLENGALATWEYALAEGGWKEVIDLSHWPEIPLFPLQEATALKWYKLLLRQAVFRLAWLLAATASARLMERTGR